MLSDVVSGKRPRDAPLAGLPLAPNVAFQRPGHNDAICIKSALRTARAMGLGLIVRFLLRRLTIEYAENKARELFRCSCKAIISPFPEIGMDVDKVHQYRLVCSVMGSSPV